MSSIVKECWRCKGKFGAYRAVKRNVISRRAYLKEDVCPKCRAQELKWAPKGIVADLVKEDLEKRETTKYQLEMEAGLPKEFIDYCLRRVKPYFKKEAGA